VSPVTLFLLFLKASLFSTGGLGNVPSLHADLLGRGWATERQFGEAIAVGQVSPGPNGLWAISLGYLVDGVRGALLAALAITLPPFLVLPLERGYQRVKGHPLVEGFVRGLSLAVVGLFAVVLVRLLGQNLSVLALASALLGAVRRVPVVAVVAAAGLVGVLCSEVCLPPNPRPAGGQ